VTDTVTGAQFDAPTHSVSGLPAQVTLSRDGYISRTTWITTTMATVDLIPEAGFDLEFYRQLARGGLDNAVHELRVLATSPRIYLQTAGLPAANVAALEQAARDVVPAFTGGVLTVAAWETGEATRAPTSGSLLVEIVNEPDGTTCGRASVGAPAGQIWLNVAARCSRAGFVVHPTVLAHELGHSLGFRHVDRADAQMNARASLSTSISALERHHGAIACKRVRSNTDIDVDPAPGARVSALGILFSD
jgi:hypothetical protein